MNIVRNISWIFGANLFVSFTKWLIIVIIAKMLTPNDVGAYSLAFAISAPITLFANMKLRSLYVTEQKYNFSDYLYARNLLSLLSFILLFVIAFTIYSQYFFLVLFVSLIKIFDLQSDMYYSLPHKNEDMDYIGKLMIVKHILTLIAFFITLILSSSLVKSLFVQLITQVLFIYLVEKKGIKNRYINKKNKLVIKNIKAVLLIALPLGFVQMIFSFNASYPRYLLEYFESAEVLGYFSAIAYILTIGNMMMNAISQNFLPYLSKLIHQKRYKTFQSTLYNKLTTLSVILGVSLVFISYFFGEFFLTFFYGSEYAEYLDVLILMSMALAINFVSWNFDTALLAIRYIKIQPFISVIVLILNLIIGLFLIKNYGIYGAVYTLIITNLIQLVLRAFFVNKKIRLKTKK